MGLINSALLIGRSALLSYQSALQVVGNNISNAGNPDYTRQSAILRPQVGVPLPGGLIPGGGVALTDLQRNIDESVENRLRVAMGDRSSIIAQQETLSRVEAVLNELSDADLSTLMQEFFNAFSSLQNQPHDSTQRDMVLTAGDSLARELQRQREDVLSLRDELNQSITDAVERADELVDETARLNEQIVGLEAGGSGSAGALRDQRDAMLRELGELMQIEVRHQPNGGVNVYVGNEPLIQGTYSRGLTAELETVDGQPRVVAKFTDTNSPVALLGGRIEGLVEARDTHVLGHVDALNAFATAFIREVNRIHATGQGLDGMSSVTGANTVDDTTAALNSSDANLPFTPNNGSFQLTLWDTTSDPPTGTTTTIQVDLDGRGDDDTTLQSLVDDINANVNGVTAAITADNRLSLTADAGTQFTVANDTSDVLSALGVNVFFTGNDAQDIAVETTLRSNPRLLAAATGFAPGDGTNAQRMAALETETLDSLNQGSLTDVYNALAGNVAVKGAAAVAGVQAADAITLSLQAQSESISGVSLDEETVQLLRLERAFQGAARYTSVVDRMMQEMLSLVR